MTRISAYPADIAATIRDRWRERDRPLELLPPSPRLIEILDVAYQASLLHEEGDSIQCRLIVADPDTFEREMADGACPLHVLRFTEEIPCTPHNLRKLAGAGSYYRALMAISKNGEDQLTIWGLVVTGTQWVNRIEGSREDGPSLPHNLVVHAAGPGHIIVASGHSRIVESSGGELQMEGFDPFRSTWLPRRFGTVRENLLAELAQEVPDDHGTEMCDSFIKDVAQSLIRRVLRLVKNRAHGGMLVYLPEDDPNGELADQWFRFRVRFSEEGSAFRFRKLMKRLIRRSREVGNAKGLEVVTWKDYQQMHDAELTGIDAELIEFGHLLADFMSIDGTLVLDRAFRLIGFGGEILGDSHVQRIDRAIDLEAKQTIPERADAAGTRHRSAYRLVSGLTEAIAVVVSQDGDVRFVAHHNQKLTYWPYVP